MSLWSDRDVTPSEPPAGEAAASPPPVGDPSGAPRERSWGRVAIGLVLIFCGLLAFVFGTFTFVAARDEIESKAVARGLSGEPLGFTSLEPGDYTVFLLDPYGSADAQDRAIARTSCMVSFPGGGTQLSVARQGIWRTVDNGPSIGNFHAPAGAIGVLCTGSGSGQIVVTPGRPDTGTATASAVGAAFAILAGIALIIWGLIGRRVSV